MQSPAWEPTVCVAWCLIWWFAHLDEYGYTWHWMSLLRLGVIKQYKPNLSLPPSLLPPPQTDPLGSGVITHTYPHKPMTKIKVTICNHQAESPLYVWFGVWSGDLQNNLEKDGHTWHWMSLLRPGVIKQYKPSLSLPPSILLSPPPPSPRPSAVMKWVC